jgi:NTP pyrophosphatase (non-canonical NTP hydrolase)
MALPEISSIRVWKDCELSEIDRLIKQLRDFAELRDWSKFHSPKNLAMALSVEAAELLEHFQWLSETESQSLDRDKLQQVEEELADVFLYLLRLSDTLELDLISAAHKKLQKNSEKYPAELVKGSSKKYTEY